MDLITVAAEYLAKAIFIKNIDVTLEEVTIYLRDFLLSLEEEQIIGENNENFISYLHEKYPDAEYSGKPLFYSEFYLEEITLQGRILLYGDREAGIRDQQTKTLEKLESEYLVLKELMITYPDNDSFKKQAELLLSLRNNIINNGG